MYRLKLASALLAASVLITAAGCASSDSATPKATSPGTAHAARTGAGTGAATSFADWPAYHGSRYRTGYAKTMARVVGGMRVTHRLALDGKVYASPIVVHGVTIVATENDTVYAFDASFKQLWKTHLGTPSPGTERPCGNIDPLGITGTPIYDSGYNSIYVAPEYSGNPPTHELVSLNATTGAVKYRKSLDYPGVDSTVMQQRGALAVSDTRVWVPFGGMTGDCGAYKGRVIGLARADGGSAVQYTVPTAREAGIWAPPGVVADVDKNLFVSVGNGESGVGDPYDHSDSILRLSAQTGKLLDFFAPKNWAQENDGDVDLGSQGPTILGKWIFSAGKSGTAYVLNRSKLGGIGGQVSSATVCRSFGGTATLDDIVYVPCTDGVRAVRIDSTGHMHVVWHAATSTTGSPVIGGRRVWSLDVGAGILHAFYPDTGSLRQSVSVGAVSRFATPALYGHNVIVPTLSGITVVTTS